MKLKIKKVIVSQIILLVLPVSFSKAIASSSNFDNRHEVSLNFVDENHRQSTKKNVFYISQITNLTCVDNGQDRGEGYYAESLYNLISPNGLITENIDRNACRKAARELQITNVTCVDNGQDRGEGYYAESLYNLISPDGLITANLDRNACRKAARELQE